MTIRKLTVRKVDRGKWHAICLYLPKAWLPLIEKAAGDMPRAHWIRELIRDALKVEEAWGTE